MKLIYILILSLILSCNNNLKSKQKTNSNISRIEKGYLRIDSTKVDDITIDYKFYFCLKNKKKLVNKIRNQDNSIVFKKKFSVNSKNIVYDCYEVNDLTTGIVWNFLHNKNDDNIYETDKYDLKAIGDTIDRNKINFVKLNAIVFSSYNNKSYKIRLRKIYPEN